MFGEVDGAECNNNVHRGKAIALVHCGLLKIVLGNHEIYISCLRPCLDVN